MSVLFELARTIYREPWATSLRESEVVFPLLQAVHITGVAVTAGSIAIVDFRLLGWILRDQPVAYIAERLTLITWIGFLIMVTSGGTLLAAESVKLFDNIPLRLKFIALIAAGVNMLVFQTWVYPKVPQWGNDPVPPVPVRIAAALSLLSWSGVIIAGRLIAYYVSASPDLS